MNSFKVVTFKIGYFSVSMHVSISNDKERIREIDAVFIFQNSFDIQYYKRKR